MFHVLPHEPEMPAKTGSLIRPCANTGCRPHLVELIVSERSPPTVKRTGLEYYEPACARTQRWMAYALAPVAGGRLSVVEAGTRFRMTGPSSYRAKRYCSAPKRADCREAHWHRRSLRAANMSTSLRSPATKA
jgi:tRNA(Leu) C34 or U34 (ribose-2'-O)-methylase TrmL